MKQVGFNPGASVTLLLACLLVPLYLFLLLAVLVFSFYNMKRKPGITLSMTKPMTPPTNMDVFSRTIHTLFTVSFPTASKQHIHTASHRRQ